MRILETITVLIRNEEGQNKSMLSLESSNLSIVNQNTSFPNEG